MSNKPIKGVVAIAVDENGNWTASGFQDDPDGREATNCCLDVMGQDDNTTGMIAVYLKPIEFWPAKRQTLCDKPLLQDTTGTNIIEDFDEAVSVLFGDCEVTLDHEIAKALEKLKSLVRLRAYVKSEVSYYEADSVKTTDDSVKEAMSLCGGNGQSVIKHSVERKVEQTHKETVTITSSSAADKIAEVVATSPGTVGQIEQEADLRGVDVNSILARDSRFVHRARRWWVKDSLPQLQHRDGESILDAYARQLAEFIAKFGPVSQTDANKILKIPTARIVSLRDKPPFASDGSYRLCLAENLPEDKRYNSVHSKPTEEDSSEESGTNGTTAVKFNTDITSRAGERSVETPPARPSSRQVEIKPCDKCGGPLGDGIRPFICPVCDVSKTIDDADDPDGYMAVEIETYVRKCVRQNQNGMMLISDIANNMGIGEASVAEVIRSMPDMSHTSTRVLQKLVS